MVQGGIPGFAGEIVVPGDPCYESARRIWNAMIDRRPAVIARCSSPGDVATTLRFARAAGLEIAVRGGGHSMAGYSVCDDGVVIDLSRLREIAVDADTRRVRAGGGCLLRSVDEATQRYGLVVPSGAVSHTGIGGLALGGGFGHLMRKYGLTIDSLESAEVVLADGTIVTASENEHADLFWGLRGGGGNFGVVTEFAFRLHEIEYVVVGAAFHLPDRARPALERWREQALQAADELNWMCFLRKAPRLPWVAPELVDQPGLISMIEWSGDLRAGDSLLRNMLAELEPDSSTVDVVPFLVLQSMFDEVEPPGNYAYAKAGFIDELDDAALDVLLEHGARIPSWRSQLEVMPLAGAVERVAHDATAFAHRAARWVFDVVSVWDDPIESEVNVRWAREAYDALAPFATGGAFVNYMGGEEPGGSTAAYGTTLSKLRSLKRVYDPDNVFRRNQNIEPA